MPTEDTIDQGVPTPGALPQPSPDAPPTSWDDIFKHPRFKELDRRAKAAEAALTAQQQAAADAEQAKLKEQGQWQAIAEANERKAMDAKAQAEATAAELTRYRKQTAIERAMMHHDPPFVDDPDMLVMFKVDALPDDEGLAKAAEAQVKALAIAKPWLLQTARTDPGSPPGRKPVGGATKPTTTGKPMGI